MDSFLHDLSWVVPLRSPWATPVFEAFTWLGYTPFFMAFLPLGYWLWNKDAFTRLAVLIALTGLLNAYLKDFWQDARPDPLFALDGRVGTSFGLPSGHAQIATVMWLWLAYEIRKPWAWAAAVILIAGVAFSRLYLGVHDVEDVLAGIALGLVSLALFGWFVSDRFRRWHDLHPAWQVALMVLVQPVLWYFWPANGQSVATLSLGMFLVGWWAGAMYDRHRLDIQRHPEWWALAVVGVVGVVSVFALFEGLGWTFGRLGLEGLAAGYATTFILALYMTVLAPLAFRAARLAR